MHLNDKQAEAVHHKEGPLLILAGAGSGKTTVLAFRTAEMIQKGILPEQLLCVTFTNKAVQELKERIERQIGQPDAEKMTISTFHSLGRSILRQYGEDSGFSVASQYQTRQLIKTILENVTWKSVEAKTTLTASFVIKSISLLKNELVFPQFFTPEKRLKEWVDADKIKQMLVHEFRTKETFAQFLHIYMEYEKALSAKQWIDMDGLLSQTVYILTQQPDVLHTLQNTYQYIMVDEYQDSNRAQYAFTQLLARTHRNLTVVGDDHQSIYKFRGSDMRNIINFLSDYPDAKEIYLEENYRSTNTIIQASNQLIRHNKEQKEKTLFTSAADGDPIVIHEALFALEEAEYVAGKIQELVSSGEYTYRDIAVFYRNNADSSVLETVFPQKEIPFVINSEASFFERQEIKDIVSYLQFLLDPSDPHLFAQTVNTPKRGIGTVSIHKMIENNEGPDFIHSIKYQASVKLNKNAEAGMRTYVNLMKKFIVQKETLPAAQLISELIEELQYKATFEGLERYIRKEKEDYLEKLIEVAKEMEWKKGSPLLLQEFLHELVKTDVDALMTDDAFDRVNLLTIHASKGLEFPVAFVIGMKEEGFPSKFASTAADIAEERRLCYVAFTRAKKRLFLTYPKHSLIKNAENPKEKQEKENMPSRFLSEFDQSLATKE